MILDEVVFEIIPTSTAMERARALPTGSLVAVTASPSQGMEATIDAALALTRLGMRPVPHLSARLTKTAEELQHHVGRLQAAGVTRALVIGGDDQHPGAFHDAASLLRALDELGRPFSRVGVAGYPEGHPFIPGDRLLEALLEKQPMADYVVTQMCFDPSAVIEWTRRCRKAGVRLPVVVGMPGAVDPLKLIAIAAKIGVGGSLKFLSGNRRAVARLVKAGRYTPDDLLSGLASASTDETLAFSGIHLFTFNQVERTLRWYESATETGPPV